jgi:hypothetical protein
MLKISNNQLKKDIFYGDTLIATVVNPKKSKIGLTFLTKDNDFIQLGIWNYKKGKHLKAHYHNWFKRESYRTSEFVYVVKGKVLCNFYTEAGEFIDSIIIKKDQGIIMHCLGHEYKILKNSIILESKNGPYLGVEKDKTLL